jgi:hypothetical protein
MAAKIRARRHGFHLRAFVGSALLAALFTVAGTDVASAYVGDSFINIPGAPGKWQGARYKNWIRIEASYWETGLDKRLLKINYDNDDRLTFSGPGAPHPGPASSLTISMNKHNPDSAQLMDICVRRKSIPELTYAESSERARLSFGLGPRPKKLPDYWEYKLKEIQISDCPIVADADDQAFVLTFKGIEWLNYDAKGPESTKVIIKPAQLPKIAPAGTSAKTKAFVITWIAPATDVNDEQCPVMNAAPTEDDYYAFMSKEDAAKERVANAKHGGVSFGGLNILPQMDWRGPDKLNAAKLPGIVRDPGFAEPQSATAYGVNLDGDDGTGQPPAGICKHKNYVSVDGRLKGVDNQLYTVMGCIAGFRGRRGYMNQTSNKHRADGEVTTLIEISGIDNEKHGGSVAVAVMYSRDHVGRDISGRRFLPNFTFRTTDEPGFAYYATRLHGHIVDGVIVTDPVKQFSMNMGIGGILTMQRSQMRLEILPDGNLRGVMAGYLDWRRIMDANSASYGEQFFGFQSPGLYHALKRNADGVKNSVTGECDSISAAYEIDAVPAYITLGDEKGHLAQANASGSTIP